MSVTVAHASSFGQPSAAGFRRVEFGEEFLAFLVGINLGGTEIGHKEVEGKG
jgi:hypothetical protein